MGILFGCASTQKELRITNVIDWCKHILGEITTLKTIKLIKKSVVDHFVESLLRRNQTFDDLILPMDFKTITSSNLPMAFFNLIQKTKNAIGSF